MKAFIPGIFLLVSIVLLQACALHKQLVHFPNQEQRVEDPEKGRVYVCRDPLWWNLASRTAPVAIYDGDTMIGTIAGHRGFLSWERPPGPARISSSLGVNAVHLLVRKGQRYFILERTKPTGLSPGSGLSTTLRLVDESIGMKELKNCEPPSLDP